jgi:hypothetical protein
MTLPDVTPHEIATAIVGVWTVWQEVRHQRASAQRFDGVTTAIRDALQPPPVDSRQPKEPTMTDLPPAYTASRIASTIQTVTGGAMSFLSAVADDWETIKASPLYVALKPVLVAAASKELAANGVPVTGAVNIASAVSSELDALAAAHPAIATP